MESSKEKNLLKQTISEGKQKQKTKLFTKRFCSYLGLIYSLKSALKSRLDNFRKFWVVNYNSLHLISAKKTSLLEATEPKL